jgi:hypothetical protein
MQVYVLSYSEYDSIGADYIYVFSKEVDACKFACSCLEDYMDEEMRALFDKEEYVECFNYWRSELYCPGERAEHPVIDIQLHDVDAAKFAE